MRFLFLGTGTSAGVPIIACDCQTCVSDDPRDVRTRTGAAVAWTDDAGQERLVLLDTTPDLRQQALRHDLRRCDAILYTHNHADHVFGLDEVRRFNAAMGGPIDVYAEERTMQDLRRIYRYIFEKEKNINTSFIAWLTPHVLDPDRPLDLWGMRFMPVRLLHGRLPVLGFRIEPVPGSALAKREGLRADSPFPLAYCTDVSGVPPESWPPLRGLRTLVLDALRFRKHPTHFTIDQACRVAEQAGADATWFVHMSHDVLHARDDAALPEGVRFAWDGLCLSSRPTDTPVGPGRSIGRHGAGPEPPPGAASEA